MKGDEAKVSIWDHSYLYGDSVFEGIRAYDGKVFKLAEHVERLLDSARSIRIPCQLTSEELAQVVCETFKVNGIRDGHGRITVSRGVGSMGLDPRKCRVSSITVMTYPFPPTYGNKAVRLITSSVRRKGPLSIDSKVKCSNYMDNILAKLQAIAAGVDEALMLDSQGYVAEATAENVFAVRKSKIVTPYITAALRGLTRDTVMEIARLEGYQVFEENMTLHDLYTADEVFLTGTAAEVVGVGDIDGRIIGAGVMGTTTARLQELYKKYVLVQGGVPIFPEESTGVR